MKNITGIWRGRGNAKGRSVLPLIVVAVGLVVFAAAGRAFVDSAWKQVTVYVDDQQLVGRTVARDVRSLLAEWQITVKKEDTVIPSPDSPVTDGIIVTVKRAFEVTVCADGEEADILTQPGTVAYVLTMAGVVLGPEDRVTPGLNSIVASGEVIKISRVTSEIITVNKELDYRVERRPNNQIEKGITQVVQRGQKGLAEETYRVVYEEGNEIGRQLLSTKVLKDPVPQIVAAGTLDVVSRGGENFRFEKAMQVTATAYTHTGNRTATGVWPQVGTIAVDPSVIPFGTRLYVEGYGYGVAQDKGSAIKGNKIDVFFDNKTDVRRWGVRQVMVYILN